MEAADILGALQARVALVPGCCDLGERPLLLVPVPPENSTPWTKERLDLVLRYAASIFSPETRRAGLSVVVDARSGSWRCARLAMRQVGSSLGPDLASLIVLRPDAFWDKQRSAAVESCAHRAQRHGEPVLIPLSRLHQYVSPAQTPEDLGGPWKHDHYQWIQNRIYMETFSREAEGAASELDKLRGRLAGQQSMLSGKSAATTTPTTSGAITIPARINLDQPHVTIEAYHIARDSAKRVVQAGRELLERLDADYPCSVPQDVVDTRSRIERLLELLAAKQALLHDAWHGLQSALQDAKELALLEERVSRVTDWILGPAENMLNIQREIGLDVASAEELREQHEALELQCRDTYGQYAELLHRLDSRPAAGLPLPGDLRCQRDFMDFACRSFATRLERRRNVLISSLRFYRLVDEYLQTTSSVLGSLDGDLEALHSVDDALRQLLAHQVDVESLERLVVRQGEKLSDLLSMPVKDALGREVAVDYGTHIAHVTALLEAVHVRHALFADSVTVRKLSLQQAGHVRAYEQDAAQAVRWLGELFRVLQVSQAHVGCTAHEIQAQKAEQQALQETARATQEYGAQLLAAARSLRASCRLALGPHRELADQLRAAWDALHAVSQEQMTRLRVSAVFHRSVQEHCKQLRELSAQVPSLAAEPDESRRRCRLRKLLASRERLLLEVGRMVRLGRLLRSRLREPLTTSSCEAPHTNTMAIEAISERLAEVTTLAEQLDKALTAAQLDPEWRPSGGESSSDEASSPQELAQPPAPASISQASQGAPGTPQQHADEEFRTASSCTCTPPSRSSSFHTASEGLTSPGVSSPGDRGSPWWEVDKVHPETAAPGTTLPPLTEVELQPPITIRDCATDTSGDNGPESLPLPPPPEPEPEEVEEEHEAERADAAAADPVANTAPESVPETPAEIRVEGCSAYADHHTDDDTDEREVLAGVLTRRTVTETRQLRVRRGGGETRAETNLSCTRLEVSHLGGSNTSSSSTSSTLSSGTRAAVHAVLHDEEAAYHQQLEDSLPLELPHGVNGQEMAELPLDLELLPPPPQELLDGLKEVRDENANHVVVSVYRHAIKGIF